MAGAVEERDSHSARPQRRVDGLARGRKMLTRPWNALMTTLITRYARLIRLAAFALVLNGWTLPVYAWAAAPPGEETPEKTYVPCYIIIIMAVVLGLTAICRMGKRSAEVRRPTN